MNTILGSPFLAEWAPTVIGGALSLASGLSLIRIRRAARRARNAVADATERHYHVLEAIREGICIVDRELRVTHINDEAERILDRTAEAGVGFPLVSCFCTSARTHGRMIVALTLWRCNMAAMSASRTTTRSVCR